MRKQNYGKRTHLPLLPCGDIDQAITFYEALGFTRTYRQVAPNPYAVVKREDLQIHLFGMPDFRSRKSYGSVIVVVPDVDALYHAFAAGLRAAYGKLPTVGIPAHYATSKKFGTVSGFSVVDVGGNWLRISKLGDKEEDEAEKKTNRAGEDVECRHATGRRTRRRSQSAQTLENGLKRYPDAPILDYARAMLYRAELAIRLGDSALARSSLSAVLALEMTDHEKAMIAPELAQTSELVGEE